MSGFKQLKVWQVGMDLVIKILNHQDDILLHYYRFDR